MNLELTENTQIIQGIINTATDEVGKMISMLCLPVSLDVFEAVLDEVGAYFIEEGHEECPHEYEHSFSEGIYLRKVRKAAGEFVLGARHKYTHQNIMISGSQVVFTSDGPMFLNAGDTFVGEAGSRKLTLTLTEVVFANMFPNPDNCEDIYELEKRLTIQENDMSLKEGVMT
jgi:hypothetical protein